MQEKIVGKPAFSSRNGDTAGDAECYTSVLRRTVRGKYDGRLFLVLLKN